MDELQKRRLRLGLLSELVVQAPCKLGRTAIMKLAYLLQVAKGVPLGYNFRLYTYGPFDSDLLNDLDQAEALEAVKSEKVTFSSGPGYGYEFVPGEKHARLQRVAANELATYQEVIQWALDRFSEKPAADLELLSTIVFADREAASQEKQLSYDELVRKVKNIKQKFSDSTILHEVKELASAGLLVASHEGD